MRAQILVRGIVQGVGFRPFVYRTALENGLTGHVRNRGDASVEIVLEGGKEEIKRFILALYEKKPPLSVIYDLSVAYTAERGEFSRFSIEESLEGGNSSGSTVPYDVGICERCIHELRDPRNRRYDYFFTTCIDCGPRYTMIEKLPYDRSNTTMRDFPMCEKCWKEYTNPSDRRFHAQTTACKECGPKVFLAHNNGEAVRTNDPIRNTGRLIEEGYIVAIKGNGGFHIATSATKIKPIMRLRKAKHRAQKPFSIMGRDLTAIRSFADVNSAEEEFLSSSARPIVLLKKSRDYYLSEMVSPGLYNIGVMLPYTGLHYLLFDDVDEPAFIMTSANPPSEPIVTDNNDAFRELGDIVDFILFHNRSIAQRCDDSVIRVHSGEKRIIRRSRGYAPAPIYLRSAAEYSALGVGAEENVNACILLGDKAFISQHVGDVESFENFDFLQATTEHLMKITQGKIDAIACDLHPKFITTKLAQEFGKRYECAVFPIQHHYAHALSLMTERGVDEMIAIVCDGAGYGTDGDIWGGEILECTTKGFIRLGHLQEQPMAGGDLAARYPLRMTAGILGKATDVSEWILSESEHFPYGKMEVEIVLKQIYNRRMPVTTSCGRVLDAVSALLGICHQRTYEGEPAMKLESYARFGKDALKLRYRMEKEDVIDTTYLIHQIFENRRGYSIPDLAYSAEEYIAESLAQLATDQARETGVNTVGFTGGVAYNEHITLAIKRILEENAVELIVHSEVPPGDGGISLGQAVAASNALQASKSTQSEAL